MDDVTNVPHSSSRRDAARQRVAAPPIDGARLAMMRRVKHMTVEERLDLFEQLSRDAAWARGAKRVR